jgi:lipopolysaccharide export system permease protein
VFALVVIVDLVELMRANSDGSAGFDALVAMALLHAPSVTVSAAPFVVLLSAMLTFAILARNSELVAARAAGLSAWRLVMPVIATAAALGVFTLGFYNPVAAAFAKRFDALEQRAFDRSASRLSVTGDGIWLRQGDSTGQTVIRAQAASPALDRLDGVTVFRFGPEDRLEARISAESAVLEPGRWRLEAVRRWRIAPPADADAGGVQPSAMRYETDLTLSRIAESFAPPETVSFWKLPAFIAMLEESGFSSLRHRLHWHRLLATPAVFVGMVLLGTALSMRHRRFGGLGAMALWTVLAGFAFFFLSDIAGALGASGAVPVLLAAWGPPLAAALAALGLLLHLEDG